MSELPVTAGGAIFHRLHRLGVDAVFVNSGTDFPPVIEGLAEAETQGLPVPRTVLVPHESIAMGMAHGYWFATGRPQSVMLHTNVGLANGSMGAINAATDHVPMLLMSGRTPTVEQGRFGARTVPIGWGQEMRDQAALVREACKWDYEVRFPEQIPELLDRALAIADSTPKGPVYLSLPREVLCEPCPSEALAAPVAMQKATIVADEGTIHRAAQLVLEAERPVIIAQRGAGSQDGFDALARLAERLAIPVCQYWAVALAVSSEHASYVGQDPMPWVADADVIVVIDSLAPWSPAIHELRDDCRVVHIGPDPLYHRFPVRNFRVDVPVTSEVGPALFALDRALTAGFANPLEVNARRKRLAAHRMDRLAQLTEAVHGDESPDLAMTKAYVASCIGRAIAGRTATVVSELGAPLDALGLTDHNSWRQEPHSGGLGWGLPCALGIKFADPDRIVVASMGDGSYMFSNPVACHHVAEAHDLPVLTVVVNNGGYGAVRMGVKDLYPTGYATKGHDIPLTSLSPSPEFRLVAESCRAYAETVTIRSELPMALERALEQVTVLRRQALLDVRVV